MCRGPGHNTYECVAGRNEVLVCDRNISLQAEPAGIAKVPASFDVACRIELWLECQATRSFQFVDKAVAAAW